MENDIIQKFTKLKHIIILDSERWWIYWFYKDAGTVPIGGGQWQ